MLFPLVVLAVPILFSGLIGIPTLQQPLNPNPLFHWLYQWINGPYKVIYKENWLKFLSNGINSVGITLFRLFIVYFLYEPIHFHSWNIRDNFVPLLEKEEGTPFTFHIYFIIFPRIYRWLLQYHFIFFNTNTS